MELTVMTQRAQKSATRSKRTHSSRGIRAAFAATVALLVGLVPFFGVTAAQAAPGGTLTSVSLEVLYDGHSAPGLDEDPNNGIVATNDTVGFSWKIRGTDLSDATFEQTLPEGWSWDPTTLALVNSSSSVYRSTGVISEDGRTLTATVSTLIPGNPALFEMGALRAIPSSSAPNGSVYSPTMLATDGNGTQTATAYDIEVVSEPRTELWKTDLKNSTPTTFHNFNDGKGSVQARYLDYRLSLKQAEDQFAIGASDAQIAQPAVLRDTFTVTGANPSAEFVGEVVGKSEPGAQATINQSGNTMAVTLDGFTEIPSAWVDVRLWVRLTDLPVNGSDLTVKNTVAPDSVLKSASGEAFYVNTDNTSVTRTIKRPGDSKSKTILKGIYLFSDQKVAGNVTADPISQSNLVPITSGTGLTDQDREVAPGSLVVSRFLMNASSSDSMSDGMTHPVAYDFWDPTQQQILDGRSIYVGQNFGSTSLSPSLYTVKYTTGSNSASPESNLWFDSIAEAGGVSRVSGIRVEYTGNEGVWKRGESYTSAYFTVGVPYKIVAPVTTKVEDRAVFIYDEEPKGTSISQYVIVGSYRISTEVKASSSSISSGANVNYTVKPVMTPPPGAEYTATMQDLVVDVALPAGLVEVRLDDAPAGWTQTTSGTPESGMTLHYAYDGEWDTTMTLPTFTYSVTSSFFAPTSKTLVTTAVISANGTLQTPDTRTSTDTVTVQQTQSVSGQKIVLSPQPLQPGDTAEWEARWYNTTTSSQGKSYFVDVLPFDGDPRGSSFAGTLQPTEAHFTGLTSGDLQLQYTTAPSAAVYAASPDDDSFDWVDTDGTDLGSVSGITALRVVVGDFAATTAGYIGLYVAADLDGAQTSDELVNNVNTWLGVDGLLGKSNPAQIDYVASSISGSVWKQDQLARLAIGQSPIPSATVTLFNENDVELGTTTTSADGSYSFTGLRDGVYRTTVDTSTLGATASEHLVNIEDFDGDLNSDSGLLTLGVAENLTDVDFGYRFDPVSISIEKSGSVKESPVAGDLVTWTFTVTNSGQVALNGVEIQDQLAGLSTITFGEWPDQPGNLAPGESVTATATSALTAAQLSAETLTNTATASGQGPASTVANSTEATATVTWKKPGETGNGGNNGGTGGGNNSNGGSGGTNGSGGGTSTGGGSNGSGSGATPEPSTDAAGAGLATTGGRLAAGALILSALLLTGGAVLFATRIRRRATTLSE
ncbi:DUF11 domain-containing protein [Leucobacter viscericola]|uniref:DUF11 domain-containing protein n=1 Tax=Leucobacter viscericola TaxID=2714935 RepID=A0A6G7XFG7_9MICO|nr:SdrD B-like domain-containing protein [Leucobacter viscericola]QIK63305.1 DUF11 domain-containing protein [Leucobacter viscericola]